MDTTQTIPRVILFSTHCPKCIVLEKKLKAKQIDFDIISDVKEIEKTGFRTVPLLKVDNDILDFMDAIKWVNNYGN